MTYVIQQAATTNSAPVGTGWQRYGSLTLMLPLSGNLISRSYSSGELAQDVTGESALSYGSVMTSGYSITLHPYAVGCTIGSGSAFTVVSADNERLKACYETNDATCKIREVKCNP